MADRVSLGNVHSQSDYVEMRSYQDSHTFGKLKALPFRAGGGPRHLASLNGKSTPMLANGKVASSGTPCGNVSLAISSEHHHIS
jgi:hypothetical protein